MKDLFKKIWEWLKTNVAKAFNWLISVLLSVPVTKLYYFIAGLIIASAVAILGVDGIQMYPAIAVLFIAAFAETVIYITKPERGWRVMNFMSTLIGGIFIQVLVLIKIW